MFKIDFSEPFTKYAKSIKLCSKNEEHFTILRKNDKKKRETFHIFREYFFLILHLVMGLVKKNNFNETT